MSGNCYFCQLCINSLAYCSFDSLYTHISSVHVNDYALENERTNTENFQSTEEDVEEIEIDYPLFAQTILRHDEEAFNVNNSQKYYTDLCS